MSSIIDMKRVLYGGGNLTDGEFAWLGSWGGTAPNLTDRWIEVLSAYGYTQNNIVDKKIAWLKVQTGNQSNNYTDLQKYALENGLYTFLPTPTLHLDPTAGITLNSGDVSSWIDSEASNDYVQATAAKQPLYVTKYLNYDLAAIQHLKTASRASEFDTGTGNFTTSTIFRTSFTYVTVGTLFGQGILSGGVTGFGFYIDNADQKIYLQVRDSVGNSATIGSNSVINDGAWYTAICTRVGNLYTMYIDAVAQTLTDTEAIDLDGAGVAVDSVIGASESELAAIAFYYDGDLGDSRIYSEALNQSQINMLSAELHAGVL